MPMGPASKGSSGKAPIRQWAKGPDPKGATASLHDAPAADDAATHSSMSTHMTANSSAPVAEASTARVQQAVKREPEETELPRVKRQKVLSKESQAAMAAIAATARLPTQVSMF